MTQTEKDALNIALNYINNKEKELTQILENDKKFAFRTFIQMYNLVAKKSCPFAQQKIRHIKRLQINALINGHLTKKQLPATINFILDCVNTYGYIVKKAA